MVVENINRQHQIMIEEHQAIRQQELGKEKLRLQNQTQFISKIKSIDNGNKPTNKSLHELAESSV